MAMVDETTKTRNNARLAILELANMISILMSLNAIIRLKLRRLLKHITNGYSECKYSLTKVWPILHEVMVDPKEEPFMKAKGEPTYLYYGDKSEMNELVYKAMLGVFMPFMKAILEGYGVERLVDVGGSVGDCRRSTEDLYSHEYRGRGE
uniref:O-methyltransferase domain-containing protein n=1 Tax=Nelumbo nucifera TaxID=4432 RepID=A0A822Y9E0_NELNU|nr:TPA_asm: hypothetical protein HUJ06_030360 [Nelumbo nucifera]